MENVIEIKITTTILSNFSTLFVSQKYFMNVNQSENGSQNVVIFTISIKIFTFNNLKKIK